MKADRNTLVIRRPASWKGERWREGLPAGNGLTGALMYGAASDETVIINRGDLWRGGSRSGPLPDLSDTVRLMREKIADGEYREANPLLAEAIAASGYSESAAVPYPLAALRIKRVCSSPFKEYARGIRMDRAEIFARWTESGVKYDRRLFVSRSDDIVFMKIKGGGETVSLGFPPSRSLPEEIKNNAVLQSDAEGGYLCYASSLEGVEAGVVARVCGKNIDITADGEGLHIEGGEYIVMLKTFIGEHTAAFRDLTAELGNIAGKEDVYRERLAANLMKYSMLYNAVSIELAQKDDCRASNNELLDDAYEDSASPALLEKLWRYGRYLFISGTSEKGNPFPLYGLWHGDYNLPWTQNVANENVQMIYRHADSGGLSYAVKALIRYYSSMTPRFEENAKRLFGCSGIYVPAYTAPGGGGPCVPVPVILNWISCAGWLSQHFYNYYLYTGDRDMLISDILPFMFKTALFYESYVSYDKDGKCVISPSVSPENTPGNLLPDNFTEDMGHLCPVTRDAVMDIAVMRELLTNLIDATAQVNISLYTKKVPEWKKLLEALPDYRINSDGAIAEWNYPELEDNYYHRHMSQLYPLFPGEEVIPESPEEIKTAFARAVGLRQLRGQSGWSLAHMSCVYARLGEGEKALECLDALAKSCLLDNFFTLHNDWRGMGVTLEYDDAPVQLDALMGAVEAVSELAARYCSGTLYILPAGMTRIKEITVRDFRFPGGMVSFEYGRDDRLSVSVYAVKDMPLRIVTPNKTFDTKLESGKSYRFKG